MTALTPFPASPAIVSSPREQWLARRAEGVTATDAADIICHALGEDHYRAPAEILAEKWGVSNEIKETEPMKWGKRMQVLIGEVYAEETGRVVDPVPDYTIWQRSDMPWLMASGDALAEFSNRTTSADGWTFPRGPLEIKTDGSRWEGGEAPMRHLVQIQIQQACLKVQQGALTAFVDRFRPLISLDVAFNQEFLDSCLPILEEFYHYLKTRTLPTDPKWYTKAATKAFWGKSNGQTVALELADLQAVNQWQDLKADIKRLESLKDEAEVCMAVRIGDAYAGALPDGSQYRITRSDIAAQLCPHGSVIKAAHTRVVSSRWWPDHLRKAQKALSTKRG